MKKFISLLCLALTACSSNKTPSSPEEITYISESSELQHISNDIVYIRDIIKTPDNKIYLLGDTEDYEFSGAEIEYLRPLLQSEYITPMLKKADKNYYLGISIYADRSNNNVQLTYRLDMPVKHVKTLRQSLQGLKPRWTNYYNDGRCNTNDFFYPAPADCKGKERPTQLVFEIDAKEDRLNGKIVKLSNRDDILKKPSLPIAIRSYVYNYRLKTDKEKRSEKWEDTKEAAKDGVKDTLMIITAPIWLPLYSYGFSRRIG